MKENLTDNILIFQLLANETSCKEGNLYRENKKNFEKMAEGSKSEKMVTLFTSQYDIVLLYVEDFFFKVF